MAAAWGAAAEVPVKEAKPGTEVETSSAAARSGFWRRTPPVEEKSPGVSAVPSASKKTRRGPSRAVGFHGVCGTAGEGVGVGRGGIDGGDREGVGCRVAAGYGA